MNTHQVLVIRAIVDRKIPGCVTGSLQDNRFASIGTSDFKDAKVSIIFWEIIGIAVAHHGHCGYGGGGGNSSNGSLPRDTLLINAKSTQVPNTGK